MSQPPKSSDVIRQSGELTVDTLEDGTVDPVALAAQITMSMIKRMVDLQEAGKSIEKSIASAQFPAADWIGTITIEIAFRHKTETVQ